MKKLLIIITYFICNIIGLSCMIMLLVGINEICIDSNIIIKITSNIVASGVGITAIIFFNFVANEFKNDFLDNLLTKNMLKYRIVKETKSKTKTVTYYIERYKKFLFWNWWSFVLDFDTLKEAKHEIDLRTEHIITEILD